MMIIYNSSVSGLHGYRPIGMTSCNYVMLYVWKSIYWTHAELQNTNIDVLVIKVKEKIALILCVLMFST